MSLLKKVTDRHMSKKHEFMPISKYLEILKSDPSVKMNAAERMLKAIGEPTLVDTSKSPQLARLFGNEIINKYESFSEFYGHEKVIHNIVSYFKHAAQMLEEKRQILYLLGPVGGAKSTYAEKLKSLMETQPIYALAINGELSPVIESPLGLFKKEDADELGIPVRYLSERMSPWAVKRLEEVDGDISKFEVAKIYPSQSKQIGISKTEPGDENNQDISALVGKTDIRKLVDFSANDPDSYSYSGGLCLSNQGLLEFVEMFKAPIKVLNPLLTATQEGNYNGTEAISSIPFDGIVLAHSNESEWLEFRNNRNNEAFLDRIYIVKVPYVLRHEEEVKIYKKLMKSSALAEAPTAPQTLELMSKFSVLSRLTKAGNSDMYAKLRAYNGENVKASDVKGKTYFEYAADAGIDEGMTGISTRFAFKVLSRVYNHDSDEISADPVHLFKTLRASITAAQFPKEVETDYEAVITKYLEDKYFSFLEEEIQEAYLDAADEYGQNIFDKYVLYADYWLQDIDYRDSDTGTLFDRNELDKELQKIEKLADIGNTKDFRNDIVGFYHRQQRDGKKVSWKSYDKIERVIKKVMFSKTDDLLPIISFNVKESKENQGKHQEFVGRMVKKGYTRRQVQRAVEWFLHKRKAA